MINMFRIDRDRLLCCLECLLPARMVVVPASGRFSRPDSNVPGPGQILSSRCSGMRKSRSARHVRKLTRSVCP